MELYPHESQNQYTQSKYIFELSEQQKQYLSKMANSKKNFQISRFDATFTYNFANILTPTSEVVSNPSILNLENTVSIRYFNNIYASIVNPEYSTLLYKFNNISLEAKSTDGQTTINLADQVKDVEFVFDGTNYTHTINLMQQTINDLVKELNYPFNRNIALQDVDANDEKIGTLYINWNNSIGWTVNQSKLQFNDPVNRTIRQEYFLNDDSYYAVLKFIPLDSSKYEQSEQKIYFHSDLDTTRPEMTFQQAQDDDYYTIISYDNGYYGSLLFGTFANIQDLLYTGTDSTGQQIWKPLNFESFENAGKYDYRYNAAFVNQNMEAWTVDIQSYRANTKIADKQLIQCLLQEPYYLQLFKEIYIISSLQSNDMIYNERFKLADKDYYYNETGIHQTDDYQWNIQNVKPHNIQHLQCTHYYMNNISFNNHATLQQNYPFETNGCTKTFSISDLSYFDVQLLDENGVVLPRLQDFKLFLQIKSEQQTQRQDSQLQTNNISRVISM